jgi:hypothetical protein
MFAPQVAKVQAKKPTNHRSAYLLSAVQRTRRQDPDPPGLTAREAEPNNSWDFSAIPIFPADRASRTEPSVPQRAPPLPATLQAKLAIGSVNDPLEHEADRVADQVMRMPAPEAGRALSSAPLKISRKCSGCEQEENLQKKSVEAAEVSAYETPASVHDALRMPGQPLDSATHAYFGPRFGRDFAQVRVHTERQAAASAETIRADAYTLGDDIVFASGKFAPSTPAGRKLLAHELTHVVQQGAAPTAATHSSAGAAGEGTTEAGDLRTSQVSEPGRLQRQPKGGQDLPKANACPPIERGEMEEAAKAQLRLVERIPQQEWLIYGFPIGSSEISEAEAGGFYCRHRQEIDARPSYLRDGPGSAGGARLFGLFRRTAGGQSRSPPASSS